MRLLQRFCKLQSTAFTPTKAQFSLSLWIVAGLLVVTAICDAPSSRAGRVVRVELSTKAANRVRSLSSPLPTMAPVRPLLLGFQDEQSFLWATDRLQMLDVAVASHARLIRVIANWSQIAPTPPSNPGDSNDPAYLFEGLDDFIWQAQRRGMRVLLTIWGTPAWATRAGTPNAAPNTADLGAFCAAIATRYSGQHRHPAVNLYSVWNEPNLEEALSPQFTSAGGDASPHLYAQMFRACHGAIKHANRHARVALGETSPRGHNILTGQPSHSPGGFAKLLSEERPALHFDAWAHHPYPVGVNGKPTTGQAWPSVGIGGLRQLERRLQAWFRRPSVPLWITEFAYQTSPEATDAPSYALQATYLRIAMRDALAVPEVQLFSWYILRDTNKPNQWQCGLITARNTPKPALAAYAHLAAAYDPENPTLEIIARPNPVVPLSVISLQAHALPRDPPIGMTYRVWHHGRLLSVAQPTALIDPYGQITVKLAFQPQRHHTYTATFDLNDVHGNTIRRKAILIAR